MNVAFFGTPQFATVTLQRLIESRHRVVAVVSQPDKPAGRGRKMARPPVALLAEQAGIPVHQPESVRKGAFDDAVRAMGADVAVVVAYGKILPASMLAIPRHGFLNVHASLLPKYRGAAPVQWAIANGERQTGVTIMQLDEGMDTGPVIDARPVDILDDDDARSLFDMLSVVGADLMVEVLDRIDESGSVVSTPQDHSKATHARLITRDDAEIDWRLPADRTICQVRGFVLWPGARTVRGKDELKILGADGVRPEWITVNPKDPRVPVGAVIDELRGSGFVVKTGGDGLVLVTRLQFAGKKEMDAVSAMNGGLVRIGDIFGKG